MYKSILFSILYDNEKEDDMISNRLNILDGNKDLIKLIEWMMYIRYLVCEVNMISPYMIYNMLLNTFNQNRNSISNDCEYYIELSHRNKFISSMKYNIINEGFNHYLKIYIDEITYIIKN